MKNKKQRRVEPSAIDDEDELSAETRFVYERVGPVIEEFSKRFGAKYAVACNEILRYVIGYASEVGEDYGLEPQPLRAVVNLFGMPLDGDPHPFALNSHPLEGDDPSHCIECDKPKDDPLHAAIKLPDEWLNL